MAALAGLVASDGAGGEGERAAGSGKDSAAGATGAAALAAVARLVATDGAGGEGEGAVRTGGDSATGAAGAADAAADAVGAVAGLVATDGAGGEGEGAVRTGKDPAAVAARHSSGEGKTIEGSGGVFFDQHDAALLVGIDGEAAWEIGGVDEETIGGAGDCELISGEGDGFPIEVGGEDDKAAFGTFGDGLAEGAGAVIGFAGDDNRGDREDFDLGG